MKPENHNRNWGWRGRWRSETPKTPQEEEEEEEEKRHSTRYEGEKSYRHPGFPVLTRAVDHPLQYNRVVIYLSTNKRTEYRRNNISSPPPFRWTTRRSYEPWQSGELARAEGDNDERVTWRARETRVSDKWVTARGKGGGGRVRNLAYLKLRERLRRGYY